MAMAVMISYDSDHVQGYRDSDIEEDPPEDGEIDTGGRWL